MLIIWSNFTFFFGTIYSWNTFGLVGRAVSEKHVSKKVVFRFLRNKGTESKESMHTKRCSSISVPKKKKTFSEVKIEKWNRNDVKQGQGTLPRRKKSCSQIWKQFFSPSSYGSCSSHQMLEETHLGWPRRSISVNSSTARTAIWQLSDGSCPMIKIFPQVPTAIIMKFIIERPTKS